MFYSFCEKMREYYLIFSFLTFSVFSLILIFGLELYIYIIELWPPPLCAPLSLRMWLGLILRSFGIGRFGLPFCQLLHNRVCQHGRGSHINKISYCPITNCILYSYTSFFNINFSIYNKWLSVVLARWEVMWYILLSPLSGLKAK